jgi:hypothetical protein
MSAAAVAAARPSALRITIWLVLIAAVGFVLQELGFYRTTGGSNSLSYAIGYMAAAAVLPWLAIALLVRPGFRFPITLAILVLAGVIGCIRGDVHTNSAIQGLSDLTEETSAPPVDKAELDAALAEFAVEIQRINSPDTPRPLTIGMDASRAPLYADLVRVLEPARERLGAMHDRTARYHAEIEAAGFERILDPARLAGDASLAESARILAAARTAVHGQRADVAAAWDGLLQDLRAIEFEQLPRENFMSGVEASFATAGTQVAEYWRLEEEIVERIAAMIDVLATASDGWAIESGNMTFGSQADADRWNAAYEAMSASARASADLQAGLQAKSARSVAELQGR